MKTPFFLCIATVGSALIMLTGENYAQAPSDNGSGMPVPPHGRCWKQQWGDEFDGTTIDPSKWIVTADQARTTGRWKSDHVQVHDGLLDFRVSRDANGTLVTGGIQSKFSATYGYFVIRAKLPKSPGYRPGFWLSSDKINMVNDPSHPTEVDILEQPTRDGRIHQNLHWNGYGADHKTVGTIPWQTIDLDQFHTYAVEWSPDYYRFFIDGKQSWESTGGGISTAPEFIRLGNEPFEARYLRTPQPSDQDFRNSGDFLIDYVRIYQAQNCSQ